LLALFATIDEAINASFLATVKLAVENSQCATYSFAFWSTNLPSFRTSLNATHTISDESTNLDALCSVDVSANTKSIISTDRISPFVSDFPAVGTPHSTAGLTAFERPFYSTINFANTATGLHSNKKPNWATVEAAQLISLVPSH